MPFVFVLVALSQDLMSATVGTGPAQNDESRQPSINVSVEAHILNCIVFKGCGL